MRLTTVQGKSIWKNCQKYKIVWEKPSRSKIQFATKQFLKPYWEKHIVYEEFPVYGTLLKVDILNATLKIAIEVNGNQHSEFNKFFHNGSRMNYLGQIQKDMKKIAWLENNGFRVIEIDQEDVKELNAKFLKEKFGLIL